MATDSGASNAFLVTKVLLESSDPEHKGSKYNVLFWRENGEITSEPLDVFGRDDPMTCAAYAREHGLLDEEGWRRFKGAAKREIF